METMVRPPRTGLEAFELMPEGTLCQLINDAIIVSPAPNLQHAEIQKEIFTTLFTFVKKHKIGKVYCAPIDVYIDTSNVFQPDILFVPTAKKEILKNHGVYGAPNLIIEILSENRRHDLVTKKKVYEQSGVLEYWVVDPVTKWCEGFELNNDAYQSMGESISVLKVKCINLEVTY